MNTRAVTSMGYCIGTELACTPAVRPLNKALGEHLDEVIFMKSGS